MKIKEKFASLSQPAKASLIFVIANIFQKGLNFLMAPINTRILDTDDYGVVSLYDSWYAMLTIIALLALYEAVYGVGLTEFKEDRDRYTLSLLVLSNIATLLCSMIYFINPSFVRKIMGLSNKLIIVMIISLFLYPALYFWTIRQRFEYKYKVSATITIVTSLLMAVLSVVAIMLTKGDKAETKVITNFLVICPVLIVLYINTIIKSNAKIKIEYWWYALKFTLPLIPHYLSVYLLDSSDRVMISKLVNKSATGVYDIACKFNSILIVIWNAVNASLIPWTYECLEKKKYKDLRSVTTLIVLVTGGLCTVVSLVIPEATKLIAPEPYYKAMYAVPPLTIGLFLATIYYMFSNVEFYHKSTVFAMFSSIIAAVVNIGLNFLLIPKFGFVVAAYTTMAGYFVQAVLHYFNMRRCEKNDVFNIPFIVNYALLVTIVNISLTKIYPHPIVRYVIVLVIMIIAVIKRKELIKAFKTIKNK